MLEIVKNDYKSEFKLANQSKSRFQFETRIHDSSQNLPLSIKEVSSKQISSALECYIEKNPETHFFCHPLWLKALENEFGREATILVCYDSTEKIKGVLPIMPTIGLPFKRKQPITGRRLSSLPRTPLSGFLFDDKNIRQLLLRVAIERTSTLKNTFLQLKSYSPELNENIAALKKFNWRPSFYLDLPDCPSKIRFGDKKRHHKVKWAVNKAISFGINIREAENEKDLKEWYKLYLETVRWHMVTARPLRFFKFLFENLVPKGMMKLLLAEYKDTNANKIIAGSIFFSYNDTVFYSFNGRNKAGLTYHANDLIQWQAIHNACERDFTFYDMGEVSGCNDTLAQFKSKWGCESKQIYHYYYCQNNQIKCDNLDVKGGGNLLRSVWRKLPPKVTQEIGILTNRFL
jgi:hypothetical protein